jgi:hypothetical protein
MQADTLACFYRVFWSFFFFVFMTRSAADGVLFTSAKL